MKKNVFLIISIVLLLLAIGTFGYLYYQNMTLENEVKEANENIKKVEQNIKNEQKELDTKEDEYEKLKEKVKDSLEELSIWEETKENLNKSLS